MLHEAIFLATERPLKVFLVAEGVSNVLNFCSQHFVASVLHVIFFGNWQWCIAYKIAFICDCLQKQLYSRCFGKLTFKSYKYFFFLGGKM